MSKTSLLMFF
jgi:malonyl-CoA/methylmalonyl-CoA synthetase